MNYTTKVQESFTRMAGLDTGPVSSDVYHSAKYFELEREQIFRRAWLLVGRVEMLPKPSDYIVREIEILNASVLITHQSDGTIAAFHNVCSHRASRVVLNDQGHASRFVCPYHAWTYRNDGSLMSVPDERGFFDFDKSKCGLTPIALEVWDGWIFVNLQPVPEVGLGQFLGEFGERLSGVQWQNPEQICVLRAEVDANWKVVADAFCEAYHVQAVHPKTLAPVYASGANPYGYPVSAEVAGAHRSLSTWVNTEYKPSARAQFERWLYPTVQTITGTGFDLQNPVVSHPFINPTKNPDWASDVKWIFPNFNIQVSATKFWTHEFWPLTPTKTRYEARFYMPKATSARERAQQEHYAAQATDFVVEDISNMISAQRGINSGAKPFLYLHDGEMLVRHSLQQIDKWVRAETVAEALA